MKLLTKVKIGAIESLERWKNEDFVVLDTETTGLLDDPHAEIIELAILDAKGEVLFDSFFKPLHPIPDELVDIHGITNEMVQTAPFWSDKWSEIQDILEERLLLIYNAPFDLAMMNQSNRIHGLKEVEFDRFSCVMRWYADYMQSEKWLSLEKAVGRTIEHRAVSDCKAVLELLEREWEGLT